MTPIEQLDAAQAEALAVVRQVGEADRERPCPCDEWDVDMLLPAEGA